MFVLLALLSALVYGVSDYVGGRVSRSSSAYGAALVGQTASLVVTAIIVAVGTASFPSVIDSGWSIAAGVASIVGLVSFYTALAGGVMASVAPVTAVVSSVVPVAAGLLQGERPAPIVVIGVVVAVLAIALVSGAVRASSERSALSARSFGFAIGGGLGFGMLFVALDRTAEASGYWPLLIAQMASLPIVVIGAVVARAEMRIPRKLVVPMCVAGALGVAANVAYLIAVRNGLLSVVAVVASLYPASTVLLAMFVDGERLTRAQWSGIGVAVIALVMITTG